MEENVALDSSKQKQFIKSIKGIKKILKGKDKAKSKNDTVSNVQTGKVTKTRLKKRGLVYLSHIPHGFYEHQMTEYFKQFGVVTNARVIRSKRTGMSKGHAFVEFRDPNVAQIVAETMDNYLMGKRLIKAKVIPPEKQRKFAKRKHWNAQNNPGNDLRQKMKKAHNSIKDEKEELQIARKLLSNLNKTKKRLRELDIDYDFFTPVDIPEPLLNLVEVKKEKDSKTTVDIKKEEKSKNKVKNEVKIENENKKKGKKVNVTENKAQVLITDSTVTKKSKKLKEVQQSDNKTKLGKVNNDNITNPKIKADKDVPKESKEKKQDKKAEIKTKINETQKQKEKKLKEAGVKPPENFIQIQKDDDDDESDSSMNFDSDEYDKVMEQGDSDVASDDESDEDLDEDITSEEDESDKNQSPPPKKMEKPSKKVPTPRNQPQSKKPNASKPSPQLIKRMPQRDTKPSKKPKFEKKGNKKTMNKVIKKKK